MKKARRQVNDFTRERLQFAREKWEHRQGNYLLHEQGEQAIGSKSKPFKESDARKIFKYIDYNEARVISKHQIRLLILYAKDLADDKAAPSELVRKLSKVLLVPELKVFDENLFAFFLTEKQPEKALQTAAQPP